MAEATYGDEVTLVRAPDTQRDVWAEFGVASQPSWAFIDDDGTVEIHRGSLGEDGLNQRIERLISG